MLVAFRSRALLLLVFCIPCLAKPDQARDANAFFLEAMSAAEGSENIERALELVARANEIWRASANRSTDYLSGLLLELELLDHARKDHRQTKPDWDSEASSLSTPAVEIAEANSGVSLQQLALSLEYSAETLGNTARARGLRKKSFAIRSKLVEQIQTPQDGANLPVNSPAVSVSRLAPDKEEISIGSPGPNGDGKVVLSIVIGPDGLVHRIRLVRGMGFGLDEKSAEAVSKWRFRPGSLNGKPIAVEAKVAVNFRLL
jgi:protein TonB